MNGRSLITRHSRRLAVISGTRALRAIPIFTGFTEQQIPTTVLAAIALDERVYEQKGDND